MSHLSLFIIYVTSVCDSHTSVTVSERPFKMQMQELLLFNFVRLRIIFYYHYLKGKNRKPPT